MSFQKKVMILSDVRTGVGSGILRFVSDGGRTVFNTSLRVDDVQDATMIIRIGDKILSFNAENGERNLGTLSLSDNIDCVIAKNGKTLYFGTTGNDKFRCFNLLSDFEKKTENRKKSAVKKQENPVEKTRKKDENVDLSTASETAETARFSPPDEPPQDALDAGFRVESAGVSAPDDFAKGNNYTGNDFYLAVKPQLDEMFICFPKNTDLENAVPNSKWVDVSGDDGNYVEGLIFNLDEVEYICYGVPYEKKSPPPDEI